MSPWSALEHGVNKSDKGGRQVWRFRQTEYGVIAMRLSRKPKHIEIDDHTRHIAGDAEDLDEMARSMMAATFAGLVIIGAGGLTLLGALALAITWIVRGFGG